MTDSKDLAHEADPRVGRKKIGCNKSSATSEPTKQKGLRSEIKGLSICTACNDAAHRFFTKPIT
ncbi:hypothetical protein [Achromobacter ruhlandii]|uniref:hypothetical protein n=1 Tax=Achromobacter ruhlandii TaxID=72557 RepID=UPI003B9CA0D8